ncbi:MAG: hypothetical protein ABL984_21715 [Pyrinomonadaceae bacterium]
MIDGLPFYVPAVFFLTTLATIWFLVSAARSVRREALPFKLLIFLIPLWMVLTDLLATTDFYRTNALPPRVPFFAVLPSVITIHVYFVFFRQGFVDKLSLKTLTLLHLIRFPVELVLHWLYEGGQVPRIMTYEGWNFDILSGLTAPLVYWVAFRGGRTNRTLLIVWNLLTLGLLINIVAIAFMSFPSPIQRFGFDQPNVGLTYLPFIWLASIVVPIVLFAHLASLYNSLRTQPSQSI